MKIKIIETNSLLYQNLLELCIWGFFALLLIVYFLTFRDILLSLTDERFVIIFAILWISSFTRLIYWIGYPRIYTSKSWIEKIKKEND